MCKYTKTKADKAAGMYSRKSSLTTMPAQNEPVRRNKEQLTDFIGSSYSRMHGISYRPVTREEAWEMYLENMVVWFASEDNLDDARFSQSMTKYDFHRTLRYDDGITFPGLIKLVREWMSDLIGPGNEIHYFVQI